MTDALTFVALTDQGAVLARKLAAGFPAAELHGYDKRVAQADVRFFDLRRHLSDLYTAGRPVVVVASVGIVARILAPLLIDKYAEPPVICIAENGASVVPVLGGHRGGNDIARAIASALDVAPAITTAGDARFGVALDNPPPGWRCSNPAAAKDVMAALLADAPVTVEDDAPAAVDRRWLPEISGDPGGPGMQITVHLPGEGFALHPAILTVGVGCERGAAADELLDLVRRALVDSALSDKAVACIATIDLKEDEPAMRELAESLNVPLRLFPAAALEAETPRVSAPSDIVFDAVGSHSVAEAAALAAAGGAATLAVPKLIGKRTTCAIAMANGIVDPMTAGRGCGELRIVGLGPGHADWRAPEATNAINTATDIVGYRLYLDLVKELVGGKNLHPYGLGEERDRVIHALDLAAAGSRTALVCSGDAGIYAMAAVVFELIDRGDRDAWRRIDVRVVPGISALQAAAARAGAPLGHDFCCISLSDLLTPWEVIERRLRAAAEGDFVVALYNPVSRRRQKQLLAARDILLAHRRPETPVIIARNLGREGEGVTTVPLAELTADKVDMLTLVIVGSTETTTLQRGDGGVAVYTPRGYRQKETAGS